MRHRRTLFGLYLAAVSVGGVVAALVAVTRHDAFAAVLDDLPVFVALSALLIAGELRPVALLRLPKLTEEPAAPSTTFVFAVLLLFGLPGALLTQAVASLLDDLIRRRAPVKVLFNLGDYALSLTTAAAVFELSRWPLADGRFDLGDVPPTVAAAVAYFLVNNLLIGVVIALHSRTQIRRVVPSFLRDEAPMEFLLLCLAPLAAIVGLGSPLLLPLLLLPSLTIYVSSRSVLEMERQARTDALTQLPNRDGFKAEIARDGGDGRLGGVVLLDLAGFKHVNDTLGHAVGDRLLIELAGRLRDEVDADLVARLSGDEFVLYSSSARTDDEGHALASRALDTLHRPFLVDRLELAIEASAGVAVAAQPADTVDELLRRADIALHVAKSSPDQVVSYDPERDQTSRRHLRLLGELRAAIAEGQLVLHFQPQAELATGEMAGLEALLRWDHPELGLIRPDEFVPQAEHSTLIRPLTRWAIEAAVAETRRQLDQRRVLKMSVNVSGRALHDHSLPVDLADVLGRYNVPAGLLTIEVTESALADLGEAAKVLNTLATMGIGVAIDDFGTGYSSLTYLKKLPVSEVKIDRSFVHGIEADGHDAAIVRSTIELAKSLQLSTVAEGVESAGVARALQSMGCDRVQGYLIAKPLAGRELDDWLKDWPALAFS